MTYKVILKNDDSWDLEDPNGNLISENNSMPFNNPGDVIDKVINDLAPGNPSSLDKEDFKNLLTVIATRDWIIEDRR